jgi:hypothetical protein
MLHLSWIAFEQRTGIRNSAERIFSLVSGLPKMRDAHTIAIPSGVKMSISLKMSLTVSLELMMLDV